MHTRTIPFNNRRGIEYDIPCSMGRAALAARSGVSGAYPGLLVVSGFYVLAKVG
jgi:hypothetical protein